MWLSISSRSFSSSPYPGFQVGSSPSSTWSPLIFPRPHPSTTLAWSWSASEIRFGVFRGVYGGIHSPKTNADILQWARGLLPGYFQSSTFRFGQKEHILWLWHRQPFLLLIISGCVWYRGLFCCLILRNPSWAPHLLMDPFKYCTGKDLQCIVFICKLY